MKTRTNSAIAITLVAAMALIVVAQDPAPAPAQNFEAVAAPQLLLEPAELDKASTPEEPPKAQIAEQPPVTPTESPVTSEQLQAIGQEMTTGDEASATASDQQPAGTDAAQPPSTSTSLIKSVAALCFVLALILAIYYVVNRYGKKSPLFAGTSLGTILGRIYLSPKAELHFVRVKDRVLVVGVTANEISRVAEFDAAMFEESQRAEIPAHVDLPPPEISGFARELRSQTSPEPTPRAVSDEIASLRAELEKARQYFRETSGESGAL